MTNEPTQTTTGVNPRAKLTLREAAELNPYGANYHSLFRAARYGTTARNGERVNLEHERVCGRIFTTLGAIEDYAKRLAAADAEHFARNAAPSGTGAPRVRTRSARERQVEAAEAELSRWGI